MPEEEVAGLMEGLRVTERESAMWRGFGALDETVIANYLKDEHDQTAAAILNNVDTTVAAKVLPLLGSERMHDIAERMIAMEAVPLHMMQQIEETLKQDILSNAMHTNSMETHQRMADLFNQLDGQAFEDLADNNHHVVVTIDLYLYLALRHFLPAQPGNFGGVHKTILGNLQKSGAGLYPITRPGSAAG